MVKLTLLFRLSLWLIFINAGFIRDHLLEGQILHIDRLDNQCRGKKNVPYQGYFQGVKTISTSLFIKNYTLVVKEDGFKNLMLSIIIERCISKENLDTCEEHFKQPNKDFCEVIDPKSKIQFMFPLVPEFKCPIKKGTYHAYNVTHDLRPFIFFELGGWYWKVKTQIVALEQNRVIYCVNTEAHVIKSRLKGN